MSEFYAAPDHHPTVAEELVKQTERALKSEQWAEELRNQRDEAVEKLSKMEQVMYSCLKLAELDPDAMGPPALIGVVAASRGHLQENQMLRRILGEVEKVLEETYAKIKLLTRPKEMDPEGGRKI